MKYSPESNRTSKRKVPTNPLTISIEKGHRPKHVLMCCLEILIVFASRVVSTTYSVEMFSFSFSSFGRNLGHLIKISITWPIFELGHPDFAW